MVDAEWFRVVWYSRKLHRGLLNIGVKNLTCIDSNARVGDFGIGLLLKTQQMKKII